MVGDVPAEHLQRVADRIAPVVTPHSRRWTWAGRRRADRLAGGAGARGRRRRRAERRGDGRGAPTPIDAAVFETLAPPPAPSPPPDLTLNETSATLSTTMAPAPPLASEPEPPRPITRRLWFWLAISGAVVAASLVVIAAQNPSIERPDCPSGYVCPK